MAIHATAIIEDGAIIGNDVVIGPYCLVASGAVLGDGTEIAQGAVICGGTRMGVGCRVHAYAVVGDDPQYVGFDRNLRSGVVLGDGCVIREHVTVHRSIYAGKDTVIGNKVYLMVGSHVGHDCVVEDQVVLTNHVLLAGHATIGRNAYIGGAAAIHQFTRVGEGAMVAGVARITQDVAPFLMVSERNEVNGFNLVGLKRRGVSREVIKQLKALFHELFHTPGNIREQARVMLEQQGLDVPAEIQSFLSFFFEGKRGFCGVGLKAEGMPPAKQSEG
jgi:UDP-N-acetylglucosamine acyltransferase